MTEWVWQRICVKFCIKLEHSSTETIWMIKQAAAMGNWWLAASSWQWTCSCITSREEVFWETSNHPGDSSPLQPRFGALQFLAFPKTKSPLKGKRYQTISEIQENMMGAADGDWEDCVRSQGAYFEGDWGVIVLCTMFLVSCIFFNKCLYFSYYMARYLLDRLHILIYKLQAIQY